MTRGKRKRGVHISSLIILLIIVAWVIAVMYLLVNKWEKENNNANSVTYVDSGNILIYKDEKYVKKPMVETVMLLGLDTTEIIEDSGSYNNEYRSDFMLLLVIDKYNEEYSILHINRDTMVDVPVYGVAGDFVNYENKQIALAYNYGSGLKDSCENTRKTVSELLGGVDVDRYITLSMGAIPILNDSVGGVTVTVKEDFSAVDETLVKGETITLKGNQALTYVRERTTLEDSSNLERMERQREYMLELYQKLGKSSSNGTLSASMFKKIEGYMLTDSTINTMSNIIENLSDYEFKGFEIIEGESHVEDVFMEHYLDEDSLEDMVVKLFYEKFQN